MIYVTAKTKQLGMATIKHLPKTVTTDHILAFARARTKRLISALLFAFIATSLFASCPAREINNTNNQQLNSNDMKKILIIGMDPHTIDFTNPEIPQGLTVEKIEQGAKATVEKLNSMGYDAELFLIETDATDFSNLENYLNKISFDGIVIGNGIRGITAHFMMFEKIINVVHSHAPKSKIIFNTLPTNTDEAVKRWL